MKFKAESEQFEWPWFTVYLGEDWSEYICVGQHQCIIKIENNSDSIPGPHKNCYDFIVVIVGEGEKTSNPNRWRGRGDFGTKREIT